jgi:hypothetical protein
VRTSDEALYRVSQEEISLFSEGIVSIILSKKSVYVHVPYIDFRELFHCDVHCTDKKHAMLSHELLCALMLMTEFSKMRYTR